MKLRLVLGRAGSGKTRFCLDEIRENIRRDPQGTGPALVILTPEQASLQMELDLHRAVPETKGFSRVQVLSFRRLAWRVLQETGGAARPHLGEMGKRMALRSILNRRQDDLALFAPLAGSPGFVEQLAHTVAELKLYRVEPSDLQQVYRSYVHHNRENSILGRKLHDLALIYNDLEEYLAGRYLDPDDYLSLLAMRLPEAQFIRGGEVWIDGFNSFTPQEEAVLQALLKTVSQVTVTLCMEPGQSRLSLGETELFHLTNQTCRRLRRLARSAGVDMEPDFLLKGPPPRYRSAPALAHIESSFGRWPLEAYKGPAQGIKLVAAANYRVEVEAAAREIIRLVREENLHWREIGVLVRDLEPYHDLIVNIFRDCGIPFFIDRRRPVGHHPLVELVRSALEVVMENWPYDAVFRYLKSDLVPVSRQEVDLLENYVLAWGIRGNRWLDPEPWQYTGNSSQVILEDTSPAGANKPETVAVHRVRLKASSHLLDFYRKIHGQSLTVKEMTAALMQLLQDLRVPQQLEKWRFQAAAAGDLNAAQEHEQVWDGLVDLIDELVTALDDAPMELEDYAAIINTGLDSLKLGLIPPALDQVVAGTIQRSRQPELQAVLILGVVEGLLPARITEDATFNDNEREELLSAGIELAPTGSVRLFHEEYLTYLALTRSRCHLWLSYPMADSEGKSLAPSPLIRRLRQLLPDLREEVAGTELPGDEADLYYLTTPRQAAGYLAGILSKGTALSPLWQEVYSWLLQDVEKERWMSLLGGVDYHNQAAPLEREITARLYPQPLRCSISQLETFAMCPFRYFLTYGLRLKERRLYQVDPGGVGQFYHAALKLFIDELRAKEIEWSEINWDKVAAIVSEVTARLVPAMQFDILSSSARYNYLQRKLEQTLQRAVTVLTEHARRSEFKPLAVEVYFGRDGDLPPLLLNTPHGQVVLEGRVDRIDAARYENKCYIRVIDYKSSPSFVDLDNIYYGLSLQLPLYLKAALEGVFGLIGEPAEPAGILYFAVRNPILRQNGPVRNLEIIEQLRRRELRMKGLLLAEPAVIRLMDREVETSPDLLPVRINKNGSLRKGSPVADRKQMADLLDLARLKAEGLATDILSGRIDIRPYYKNKTTGCDYCIYRSVCGFDLRLPGMDYHRLAGIRGEFWQRAAEVLKAGGGNG